MKSKAYTDWMSYKSNHPEIADVPSAEQELQRYEEQMTAFIIGLFK
ncbi:MAG: hypothetical protein ACC608_05765 [Anaerofustis sp.]